MALPNDNTITLGAVATEFGVATEFKACCTAAGLDANVSTLKSFQGLSAAVAASHSMLVGFNVDKFGFIGTGNGSISPTTLTTPLGDGIIVSLNTFKQSDGDVSGTFVNMEMTQIPQVTSSLLNATVIIDFVGSGLSPVLSNVVSTGLGGGITVRSGDRPDIETYLMNNYNSNVDVDIQFL
jgi:hypothetical protein